MRPAIHTIARALMTAAGAAAIIALIGLAGRSDYDDALIVEMKDNGAYHRLASQHPGASDHRLATIYEAQRDSARATARHDGEGPAH